MTRLHAVLLAGALLGAACTPDTPDTTERCAKQTDCAAPENCSYQYARVCDSEACATLDPLVLQDFKFSVRSIMLQFPKSFRVWALHPRTPAGQAVGCSATTYVPTVGGTPVANVADLVDPAKANLVGPLTEMRIATSGDVIQAAIFLPGPGNVVYAEVYDGQIQSCTFGPEGKLVGRACLENAPFVPQGGTANPVVLDIKRIAE